MAINPNRRTKMKEYHSWENIIQRCTNPKHTSYHRYGGRGITICDRWRKSFDAFLEDMGRAPTKDHTVGRIDNNKGYEPGNCEWQTRREQQGNRCNTRYIQVDGETTSLSKLAVESGFTVQQVATRVLHGWSKGDIINKPIKPHKRNLVFNGKSQSMSDWSRELGISPQTISTRLRRGATDEEALQPVKQAAKAD